MYSNAANAGRTIENLKAEAAQKMGLLQGQQNLGYQGLADNFTQNMNNIGLGVDASNSMNAGALTGGIADQMIADRERKMKEIEARQTTGWDIVKGVGKIVGSVYGM